MERPLLRRQRRTVPPPTRRCNAASLLLPRRQPQPRPVPCHADATGTPPRAFLARSDVVDKQVRHFCFYFFFEFSHASKEGRCCRRVAARPSSSLWLKTPQLHFLACFSQVIARTSGRCLGVVDHMFVDAETYRVVSSSCVPRGSPQPPGSPRARWRARAPVGAGVGLDLGREAPQQQQQQGRLLFFFLESMQIQQQLQQPTGTNLPLATLCQVGDVVLVHDERALSFPPLDSRRVLVLDSSSSPRGPGGRYSRTPPPRMVRLTGAEVVPADGGACWGKCEGTASTRRPGSCLRCGSTRSACRASRKVESVFFS